MTRSETEALLRYRWATQGTKFGDQVVDAWSELLGDVPEQFAQRALVELIRAGHQTVSLAQIMERVAAYRRVARERAPTPAADSGAVISPREGIAIAVREAAREMRRRGKTDAQIKAHLERFVPLLPGYEEGPR